MSWKWEYFTLTLLTILVETWLRKSWLNGNALAVMTKSKLEKNFSMIELKFSKESRKHLQSVVSTARRIIRCS